MDQTNFSQELAHLNCSYALYLHPQGQAPFINLNCERFLSASIIKLPILLAWAALEQRGELDRAELGCIDDEPEVQGAGFSWLLRERRVPFQDILLMMIALSDNLCTNLIIRRIGLERLREVMHDELGLKTSDLQRKLMDTDARARGLDNWVSASDCVRLFDLFHQLSAGDKAWIEPMLLANQDAALLLRDVPRDTVSFYHKTGSMEGVLHDWGYTPTCDLFLLTNQVRDEVAVCRVFGAIGAANIRP